MKRGIDKETGAMMYTPGIDYSGTLPGVKKLPNVDPETGIRYGVINQYRILQAWADSSEAYYPCEECESEEESSACDFCEASSWFVDAEGILAECGENGDIFVIKSPVFTYAQFCSPCAPGACYLTNPCSPENAANKCYCFPADWFDEERPCPYPIWEVESGKLVYSPAKEDAE